MLKAVIFDMDGVIVDTEPQHLRAMIKAGEAFHANMEYSYCEQFIGCNAHDTLTKIQSDFEEIDDIKKYATLFNQYKYEIKAAEGLVPIEGTVHLLKSLPSHGIKVAIASSSAPDEIDLVLKTLGLADYVDVIASGSMVKHSKPEPDIFLLAADQLGCSIDECIIIEDSMNGSIAASRAHIPCIGFQNKNSGNQDLSRTVCIYEDMNALDYSAVLEEYLRYHKMPVTILTTTRLTIKELTVDDIATLHQFYEEEETSKYIPKLSSLKEEQEKHHAYIDSVYNFYRFGLWGVYLSDTMELIGRAGLQCIELNGESVIELGYLIKKSACHNGYGYECSKAILDYAKDTLAFDKLVALVHKDNTASIHLAHKLGFQYDCTTTINGEIIDVYCIHF